MMHRPRLVARFKGGVKTFFKRVGIRQPAFTLQLWVYFLLTPAAWVWRGLGARNILWLIDERLASSAHDNGYVFFRYMRDKHPDKQTRFIIKKSAFRILDIPYEDGFVFQGSLKHLFGLHFAQALFSTDTFHRLSPPTVQAVTIAQNTVNVFLQHGVAGNKTLTYQKRRHPYFNLVITSTEVEQRAFATVYGYAQNEIALTGIARFDRLVQQPKQTPSRKIIIAPTWRRWLKQTDQFMQTPYAKNWTALLQHPALQVLAETRDLKICFCPHFNMHKHLSYFQNLSPHVEVHDMRQVKLGQYIADYDLLITDYSSIMYDFFFQNKPVIPFMFDRAEWESQDPGPPHIDFNRDLPAYIATDADAVISQLAQYCASNAKDINTSKPLFMHYDTDNCARIYAATMAKISKLPLSGKY